MKEQVIYSVRVAKSEYGGIKICHVKIGKTKNIEQTLSGYKRSNIEVSLLDLWHANTDLDSSTCERGVQKIAEKYAYKRENEKFIFLQDSYGNFTNNVNLLLKKINKDTLESTEIHRPTRGAEDYKEKNPVMVEAGKKAAQTRKQTKINKFRIGNDRYIIGKSYEILTKTAEWLINKGELRETNCPITTGRKRNLIHTVPKHRDNENFVAPKELSSGLYIETHFSTAGCIKNARRLLESCGQKGQLLKV